MDWTWIIRGIIFCIIVSNVYGELQYLKVNKRIMDLNKGLEELDMTTSAIKTEISGLRCNIDNIITEVSYLNGNVDSIAEVVVDSKTKSFD